MFNWEKRLRELKEYNISFEIKQGYYHIALAYPDGWDVLATENDAIYTEQRNGIYHYIASIDCIQIEDIFKTINDTIDYNMDLQKKLKLFKEKTAELQDIFSKEDFETLQTIDFVYGKAKTKQKKKRNNKPKQQSNDEPVEKTNVNMDKGMMPAEESLCNTEEEVVPMSNNFMEELEKE